jgi:hypothetical protein
MTGLTGWAPWRGPRLSLEVVLVAANAVVWIVSAYEVGTTFA